ncbi:MAG: MBOAT family protein [Gammaproteobacteria bacterium]|nr:MBOAT family protein [Gammaproteobacteria bacterium]MBU1654005.1 MBOAT family protein [Gammaproteobacteria bacterium]MBU1960736.1 MBOAT family protein [Gammaproteobacteria bacterium]
MEFATQKFALFFLGVFTLVWAIRPNRHLRNGLLLATSYWFACAWKPLFWVTILGSTFFNYLIGRLIHRFGNPKQRYGFLVIGVIGNLAVLGFFKYYGFFTENLGDLLAVLGLSVHLPLLELIVPLGISFYTFQGIAYLVDTYQGKAVQPKSVLDFMLFMSFFPQFAAGPICRSHQLLPQIMAEPPERVSDLPRAFALIGAGLFKKMILGTYLATHMVEDAFLAPDHWSSLELLLVVFAYTAQIYLDFSGYTDIARGSALLLGFELPENFRYPYAATNIGDYWRRWHITFSSWLRDYIYFPLGGSRCSRSRCYLNLMVTFGLCGFWHGASWGFIIWGLLHGMGLVIYKASLDFRRALGLDLKAGQGVVWAVGGWALTLIFCAFTRVWFKTPNLETAYQFWDRLFEGSLRGEGIDLGVILVTLLTFALNFFGRPLFEGAIALQNSIPMRYRPVAWVTAGLVLLTLKPFGVSPTAYFQF